MRIGGTQDSGAGNTTRQGLPEFDAARAHPARVYDVWCGGKDGLAADRAAAARVAEAAPWVVTGARGNRAFVARAVENLARHGIRQFVDLGSGLPSSSNVHQIAQRVDPACRVAYIDHDPLVLTYARALLTGDPGVDVAAGDLRDPDSVLADPAVRELIDPTRPTAVLLTAVLHFIAGDAEAARITARIRELTAPGSYLVLSHAADLPDDGGQPRTAATAEAAQIYRDLVGPFTLRTRDRVTALFDGYHLIPPGVLPAHAWHPRRGRPGPAIPLLAGIGRTPGPEPSRVAGWNGRR